MVTVDPVVYYRHRRALLDSSDGKKRKIKHFPQISMKLFTDRTGIVKLNNCKTMWHIIKKESTKRGSR